MKSSERSALGNSEDEDGGNDEGKRKFLCRAKETESQIFLLPVSPS